LVAELLELGGEAAFLRADVRVEDDVRSLVDAAVASFGRLDAAVNNAGTEGTPGPVTEQSAETYDAIFGTNVLGTLLSMKHELRVMLAQGHGNARQVCPDFSARRGHRSPISAFHAGKGAGP
jgi:NAD(P)-dependent dehydrogenase (short-subunit alcohol dehydrogenase family)